MKINSSSYSSSSFTSKKYNFIKQLNNKLEITCQLELRRVSLLLLLIVGTTFDKILFIFKFNILFKDSFLILKKKGNIFLILKIKCPYNFKQKVHKMFLWEITFAIVISLFFFFSLSKCCLATNIEENEDERSKRAGARAFQRPNFDDLSYELKRGGARTFSKIENKRGGARTFSKIEEKRGGARPFYGFFGDGDSTWKRGGGRYFIRPFADYGGIGGIGGGGTWAKRGGGRQFSADKRAGGRNFFGNLDSTFDSTNYWIPPRYTPLKKAIVAVDDYQILHNSPPFYSYHFN
ncbi:hypothetical protein Mgra_00009463 [Meloidogyne graminicola]|uniref:Uncharacterized protein n=1 Tax=Meloidogyne graminicola TaxID=189291 RepID=A0A8S9Z7S6_9BILA|nr:hypothetical protein Mgra_00009463 [Meloidogyne graminicola]